MRNPKSYGVKDAVFFPPLWNAVKHIPAAANWPTLRTGKALHQTQYDSSNYEVLPAKDLKFFMQHIRAPSKVA